MSKNTPEEVREALLAGKKIEANGTAFFWLDEKNGMVFGQCFSEEPCCWFEHANIDEFIDHWKNDGFRILDWA